MQILSQLLFFVSTVLIICIFNNNNKKLIRLCAFLTNYSLNIFSLDCLGILVFLDEVIVQKPELTSPSICHAPGGEYFVEGETWNIDSCTQCTCHSGRVLCETEVCPPLLCQNPTRTQDSCCPQCPGKYFLLT